MVGVEDVWFRDFKTERESEKITNFLFKDLFLM